MMLAESSMAEVSNSQLDRWRALLEAQTGINLAQHQHILRKGLDQWLAELEPAAAAQCLQDSENRPRFGHGRSLVDHLAVKDTRFYRNPAAYRVFSEYLLRRLRGGAARGEPVTLDIWSAGCATGEEPYTLAMVASELVARSGSKAYIGVIGSDISSAALAVAKSGRYGARGLALLPGGLRDKYCRPAGDGRFEVADELRRKVCFLQSNLLDSDCAPASGMDVIFCHNVLVYFRTWRQKQVLNNLAARLKPGGILVIGPGEAPGWNPPQLQRVAGGKVQVFMRRRDNNSKQSREP